MNSNAQTARKLLRTGNYTFSAVCDNQIITSHERGIKPLLELLDSDVSLKKYSVADKVIGKAAAFLYVLLKAEEIYADVISEPARDVLVRNHIKTEYETLVKSIRNRNNTGFCPMETAVMNIQNEEEALLCIRNILAQLNRTS